MRILKIKKVEDCFDGSSVFNYWFDLPWRPEAIMKLKTLGEVEYFPHFPRPFFRLLNDNGLQVKGVEGENSCRAIFPRKYQHKIKYEFEDLFYTNYSNQ